MFIKTLLLLFLASTLLDNGNSNKIAIADPLPCMKVGNQWVYEVTLSGYTDTVTFEIVNEAEKVFEVIDYNQRGDPTTRSRFWFVHDGFLKSYYKRKNLNDAEIFSVSNPVVGKKFYYGLNKGCGSSKPIKDDRLVTFEVIRTNQTIVAAGRSFSDVFTVEVRNSFDTAKYERLYSVSHGFLSSTELQSFTLLDINF